LFLDLAPDSLSFVQRTYLLDIGEGNGVPQTEVGTGGASYDAVVRAYYPSPLFCPVIDVLATVHAHTAFHTFVRINDWIPIQFDPLDILSATAY
jgi:hypothetical protein